MKRWWMVAAALLLVSCSPKGVVIPTDPAHWDQLSSSTKQLSTEDRRLLAGYLVRQSLAGAFSGGKPSVPPGTTIGQAIAEQKKFEADATQKQVADEILKAKAAAQLASAEAALNNAAL